VSAVEKPLFSIGSSLVWYVLSVGDEVERSGEVCHFCPLVCKGRTYEHLATDIRNWFAVTQPGKPLSNGREKLALGV
jgi:hypothetical protein